LSAAQKFQSLLNADGHEVTFSKEEYGALRSGRLGSMFQEAKKCGHVSDDLIKLESKTTSPAPSTTSSYKTSLKEMKEEATRPREALTTALKFHR